MFERLKFLRIGVSIAAFSYLAAAMIWSAIFFPTFIYTGGYTNGMSEHFQSLGSFSNSYIAWGIGIGMLLAVVSALCLCSNYGLTRYRSYHFALFATMVGIMLIPINIVALPFLIWALVILCLKSTRRVFRHNTMLVASGDLSLVGEYEKLDHGLMSGVPIGKASGLSEEYEVDEVELHLYEDRARVPKIGLAILSALYTVGLGVWLFATYWQPYQLHTSLESIAFGTFATSAVVFTTATVSYLLHTKRNYHFAFVIAIFGAVCLPWNLFALPLLIWSIVVLSMQSTKKVFRAEAIKIQLERDYQKKVSVEDEVGLRQSRVNKVLLSVVGVVAVVAIANLFIYYNLPAPPQNIISAPEDVVQDAVSKTIGFAEEEAIEGTTETETIDH